MQATSKQLEPVGSILPPPLAKSRTTHVLIVDDNETNLRVASMICEMLGFTYEKVLSGKQAIEAAASNTFDLVLMDICMPEMDGVEATLGIHALHPHIARLPIIAVTANAEPLDRARYAAAGMVSVIAKPIHVSELCDAMERALEGAKVIDIEQNSTG